MNTVTPDKPVLCPAMNTGLGCSHLLFIEEKTITAVYRKRIGRRGTGKDEEEEEEAEDDEEHGWFALFPLLKTNIKTIITFYNRCRIVGRGWGWTE